jgi:hypothetical protein
MDHFIASLTKSDKKQYMHTSFFDPPWAAPSFLMLWTHFTTIIHSNACHILNFIKDDYREKESWKKSQILWRNCCDRVRSRHGRKIPGPGYELVLSIFISLLSSSKVSTTFSTTIKNSS